METSRDRKPRFFDSEFLPWADGFPEPLRPPLRGSISTILDFYEQVNALLVQRSAPNQGLFLDFFVLWLFFNDDRWKEIPYGIIAEWVSTITVADTGL